jgi:hypothetical protein
MRGKPVALIVEAYAERAGLDPKAFAGHSLRAGLITRAARKGASLFGMMDVSGHKSVNVLRATCARPSYSANMPAPGCCEPGRWARGLRRRRGASFLRALGHTLSLLGVRCERR